MIKQKIYFAVSFILLLSTGHGQKSNEEQRISFYGGIGAGLDYGGIGLKAEYLPEKHIGVFAGAGANFEKIGYNGGVSFKILPAKKSTPILTAMYGYNAVIKVKAGGGNTVFSKSYYGLSAGAGYDFRTRNKKNKISLAILVPFRNAAFNSKYNQLKAAGYTFNPGVSKVLGSIGINFGSWDKSN